MCIIIKPGNQSMLNLQVPNGPDSYVCIHMVDHILYTQSSSHICLCVCWRLEHRHTHNICVSLWQYTRYWKHLCIMNMLPLPKIRPLNIMLTYYTKIAYVDLWSRSDLVLDWSDLHRVCRDLSWLFLSKGFLFLSVMKPCIDLYI